MGIYRAEAIEPGSLGDMYKVRNKDEAGRLCAVGAAAPGAPKPPPTAAQNLSPSTLESHRVSRRMNQRRAGEPGDQKKCERTAERWRGPKPFIVTK